MQGYKIIQNGEKWHFQLIPHNNSSQEVANSKSFDSYDECLKGVKQFRKLVIDNHINSLESPFVRLVKGDDFLCIEYCIDGEMIAQGRHFIATNRKQHCRENVESIYEQIDEYTLKQVF